MIWYVCILVVVFGGTIILLSVISDDTLQILLSSYCGMMIGLIITCYVAFSEPSAMDVYRGKTTLKVTYVDSIPTDSVVVFNNKN